MGRKASEVFLEFADPLLEIYLAEKGGATLTEIEEILRLPWVIWNAVVMQNTNSKIDFMASIRLAIRNIPEGAVMLIEAMRERKLKDFAKYQYALGDFKLRYDEKRREPVLSVESRDISGIK